MPRRRATCSLTRRGWRVAVHVTLHTILGLNEKREEMMTTQHKEGPFASDALCNVVQVGSRWMLEFCTANPLNDDFERKALLDVETIDCLEENCRKHTLVHVHTPKKPNTSTHEWPARLMIAKHSYALMLDRFTFGMDKVKQQREQSLTPTASEVKSSNSIHASGQSNIGCSGPI